MVTRFILILLVAFLSQVSKASELLIKNVNVVTSTTEGKVKVFPQRWVQIKNQKITAITSSKPYWPTALPELDGTGSFLIPGLMDSHVHTGQMPGVNRSDKASLAQQEKFYIQQPRSYLFHGVTQILDTASSPKLLSKFTRAHNKPDTFFCGAVQILGGYGMSDMSIEDAILYRPYFVYRPNIDIDVPADFDPTRHTPESVVERMAADGASCIKVFIEDGFNLQNDMPMLSKDTLTRLKKASKQVGLRIVAHANAVDMQDIALDHKMDVLMHGMWNWLNHQRQEQLPAAIQNVADKIVQTKTFYQPTLNVMHSLKDVTEPEYLSEESLKNIVPAETLAWYKSHSGQWFAREMLKGWGTSDPQLIHQRQESIIHQGVRVMMYLYQQGHPMLLASDTPPAPTYASQPGLSTLNELRRMHAAGIKLDDLLMAATINNAIAFGLEDLYGTVEKGKKANLLLLNSNPLQNVEAYNDIEIVILNGEVHNRNTFKVQ
jgi:imidazolonepropionase-like amidohydrolase